MSGHITTHLGIYSAVFQSGVFATEYRNYPERLDPRFVDRPSRFDTIMLIDMPTADARRAFLLAKEPTLGAEVEDWIAVTDGFSIAHLRELVIACRCFGRPLDEVVARLDKMRTRRSTSADYDRPGHDFGFRAPGNETRRRA